MLLWPKTVCRALSISSIPSIIHQSTSEVASSFTPANLLTDKFGRKHTYLRISLTERCNLRCTYCMPEQGVELSPNENLLTSPEVVRLTELFASHGVHKVRLTGGEPTLRMDLVEIVESIAKIRGIEHVGLTSNGIVLENEMAKIQVAKVLPEDIKRSIIEGLYRIGWNDEKNWGFQKIGCFISGWINPVKYKFGHTGRDKILGDESQKWVSQGINDDEICDFVAMTQDRNLDVRFIEYMPFGGNSFALKKLVPYKEMLVKISHKFPQITRLYDPLNSTSKAYKIEGFKGRFGFITSMTEHFCDSCNRLRITADGNLKVYTIPIATMAEPRQRIEQAFINLPQMTVNNAVGGDQHRLEYCLQVCLHGNAEVSLRDKMRSGIDDNKLSAIISEAVSRKKAKHAGVENLTKMTNRPMILIGVSQHLPLLSCLLHKFMFTTSTFLRLLHSLFTASHSNPTSVLLTSNQYSTKLFSHIDSQGTANMVDTSQKRPSTRIALAEAVIKFQPSTFDQLVESGSENTKGDIFSVSRIAGICGAKQTSVLIPLCHPVSISCVSVRFKLSQEFGKLFIYSQVKTVGATGVEMEALTACSIAALTIYDMCKALSHDIEIGPIRLLGKTGGKEDFGCVEFDDDANLF